ncbi:Protein YIPF5 [Schistosoma japonicum]|uniref:Protein YIPF n=1 Tax=Schistosoma japonicum TaxID=6182 RepID=C1L6L5_SCHJA|nr:Protein YIPF5 [Schistosoma japonicum]CAX70343.1 Protein YIPF5 (YIP1 family member 5) [Schistosoma japonicum]
MNYEGYTNVYHPNSPQTGYYNPSEIQFSQFSYENANPIPSQPVNLPYPQVPYSSGSIYKGQEEDYENEPPLLEELGINFSHIVQKTSSVLVPFKESSQEVLDDTDLAGPLVFCLLFGCTLMFAGKIHFNYIYGLGVFGCLGIYLLLSVMTPRGVTPTCVVSTLGYCLLPMCLLSSFGIVFSLKSILGVIVTAIVVFWCTIASSKLFVRTLDMQHQRILVAYPCALVYCVFALLVVF